jgi:uncharacterized protein
MSTLNFPLPKPNATTKTYWDACAEGELRYQKCESCGTVQLIARSLCEHCQSQQLQWQTSQRLGTVLSFTTVYRAPLPVFKAQVPYAIVIVDMDEGFRVMANATPQVQSALAIGAKVRVGFTSEHGMAMPIVEAVLASAEGAAA